MRESPSSDRTTRSPKRNPTIGFRLAEVAAVVILKRCSPVRRRHPHDFLWSVRSFVSSAMVSLPQSQRHVHRRFPDPSSSHIVVKRPKRSPDFTFAIRSSRYNLPPATACLAGRSATSRGSGKPSCSLAFQVLVNSASDVFSDRKSGLFGQGFERRNNRLGQEYVCAFHAHIISEFHTTVQPVGSALFA